MRKVAGAIACSCVFVLLASSVAHAATKNVSIVDFAYSPKTVTIHKGDTVRWTHKGQSPHTVTADAHGFGSGPLENGQTYSHTFNSTGSFRYYCRFHGGPGGKGQSGIVKVLAPSTSRTAAVSGGGLAATGVPIAPLAASGVTVGAVGAWLARARRRVSSR